MSYYPRPLIPWVPPPSGLLKLNFDRSCKREIDYAGYGGVITNELGNTLISFAGLLPNGSVIEAELFALWRGILELEKLGVRGSLVEGDSKVMVDWVVGSLCPWLFLDKVEKIRHSITSFDFQIAWAPRLANSTADALARQGLSLVNENCGFYLVIRGFGSFILFVVFFVPLFSPFY